MIEALRVLPWSHEAQRRKQYGDTRPVEQGGTGYLVDCSACRAKRPREIRSALGCGYEPPNPHAVPWQPSNLDSMHSSRRGEFTLCPGYTTKLPEVVEVARLRMHAKMGSLSAFLGKDEATSVALVGMEILEGATNEAQGWAIQNPEKKS